MKPLKLSLSAHLPDGKWKFTNLQTGEVTFGSLQQCLLWTGEKDLGLIQLTALLRGIASKQSAWKIEVAHDKGSRVSIFLTWDEDF